MKCWNAPTSFRKLEDGSLLAALSYLLTKCFIGDKNHAQVALRAVGFTLHLERLNISQGITKIIKSQKVPSSAIDKGR